MSVGAASCTCGYPSDAAVVAEVTASHGIRDSDVEFEQRVDKANESLRIPEIIASTLATTLVTWLFSRFVDVGNAKGIAIFMLACFLTLALSSIGFRALSRWMADRTNAQ